MPRKNFGMERLLFCTVITVVYSIAISMCQCMYAYLSVHSVSVKPHAQNLLYMSVARSSDNAI